MDEMSDFYVEPGTWTCAEGHGGNDNQTDECCKVCGGT